MSNWIITEGINGGYPYLDDVSLPTSTVLTEPYPTWIWRIDQFYNGGYPYLIGLRPPFIMPDNKFLDCYGLATLWAEILKIIPKNISDFENDAGYQTAEEVLNTTTLINSTEEQPTNQKWIDGKQIYRKVVEFGAVPVSTGNIAHGITSLDTITSYIAYMREVSGSTLVDITGYYTNMPLGIIILRTSVDYTNCTVINDGAPIDTYSGILFIVEYTKSAG